MNTDVNKAFKSSVGMNNLGFYTREKIVITVSKAKDGVREGGGWSLSYTGLRLQISKLVKG